MSDDVTRKIKQKKVHFSGKPYDRNETKQRENYSFLGKVKETVKNLLSPSWLVAKMSPPPSNAGAGALLEQLTAPPLNAGEEPMFATTPEKPVVTEAGLHPYQITTGLPHHRRFVSPPPGATTAAVAPPSVPYLTHMGGQRAGNSIGAYTARVAKPPEIRVDPPNEAQTDSHDGVEFVHRKEGDIRLDVTQPSTSTKSQQYFTGIYDTMPSSGEKSTQGLYRTRVPQAPPAPSTVSSAQPSPKPAFNISLFSTSRLNDSTSLFGVEPLKSPYYPGKTMYGGASSHRRTKLNPAEPYSRNVSVRRMAAKTSPNNTLAGATVTSSTARKILDALESMSSVIGDAKKIPLNNSSLMDLPAPFTPRSYARMSARSRTSGAPPVGRLSTPGVASIAHNRQPIVVTETPEHRTRQPARMEWRMSTDVQETPVLPRSGKMRREKSGLHYKSSRDPDDSDGEDAASLPQPSFQLPVPTSLQLRTFTASGATSAATVATPRQLPFTFASPVVNTPPVNAVSPPDQDFSFSSPLPAVRSDAKFWSVSNNVDAESDRIVHNAMTSYQFDASKAKLRPGIKPAEAAPPSSILTSKPAEMKTGSVLDALSAATPSCSQVTSAMGAKSATDTAWALQYKAPANSWECPTCYIVNPSDKAKCASCTNPKPAPPSAPSAPSNAQPVTNGPPGVGACSHTSATSCSVCSPGRRSQTAHAHAVTITNDVSREETFTPAAGSWECTECYVRNMADREHCVCCHTLKPATSTRSTSSIPTSATIAFATSTSSIPTSGTMTLATSKLTTLPLKQGDKWECSNCKILNDVSRNKCGDCETKRRVVSNERPVVPSDRGGSRWECANCWIQNAADASSCISCNALKSGGSLTSLSAAPPLNPDKSKKPADSWDCDTCLVHNKRSALKCAACDTPKPGATATSAFSKAGAYQFGSVSGASGFVCGATSATPASFSFGQKSDTASSSSSASIVKIDTPSTGFQVDKSLLAPGAGGFKFGASKNEQQKSNGENTTLSSSVSFKLDSSASTPTTGGFQFGVSKNEPVTSNRDGKPSAGFSFGAPVHKPDELTKSVPAPKPAGFSFTAPSTNSESSSPNTGAITSLFKFGPMSNGTGGGTGGGANDSNSSKAGAPTSSSSGGFSFGAAPSEVASVHVAFGAPAKPAGASAMSFGNSTLTFSSAAAAAPTTGAAISSASGTKRKQSSDEHASKKAATFDSVSGATLPPFPFTAAASAAPVSTSAAGSFTFGGAPSTAAPPTTAGFSFGAPATPAQPAANSQAGGFKFTFGAKPSTDNARGDVPITPTFGAPPTYSDAVNKTTPAPAFGAASATAPIKAPGAGGSAFGATSVFGSSSPAFGSSTPFGQSSTSSAFGAPKATSTGASVFGGASAPPAFGAAQTATPTFGALQTSSTGFGAQQTTAPLFGAPQSAAPPFGSVAAPSFGAVSNNSSGFNFQAAAQQPASSGGYNFGQATPSASSAVFQFGAQAATASSTSAAVAPPTFNFAASTPPNQFRPSGLPSGGVPANPFNVSTTAGRKIKKATRKLK